jgi:hypothetical protein
LPEGTKIFASPLYVSDLAKMNVQAISFSDIWDRQYRLPESVGASAERTPLFQPQLVDALAAQVEFVVLNSYFDDELAATPENLRWFPVSVAGYEEFRARLDERADKLHEITGYAAGRAGPDITIYRLRP